MYLLNPGIIILNYDNTIVTLSSLEKCPPGHKISLLKPVPIMVILGYTRLKER